MQQRIKRTKDQYGFSAWSKNAASEVSVVVMNYVPWAEDCLNWPCSFRDDVSLPEQTRLVQTVWDDPDDRDIRILIHAFETSTLDMALECLVHELSSYTVAGVTQGPDDLGDICFVQPTGERPTVFFVRGNLCLRVSNFGRKAVDVIDWARRLDARILDRPSIAQSIVEMKPERELGSVDHSVGVDVFLRWRLGETGYFKFFSTGGVMSIRHGRPFFAPTQRETLIEAFAVESEREPYGGKLVIGLE